MKIMHLCVSCFYIDNNLYQENELVREHVALGHDVRVLASTETMSGEGKITYCQPGEYLGSDGAIVKRIPYRKFLPEKIMRKLRMHPGIYKEVDDFSPEVIVFHGACSWEILTVSRYVRRHPHVRLWIDSHEDANNSARSFVSREALHRLYYGPLLRQALPEAGRILCISMETMDFVHDMYAVPRSRLEFFPLGGRPLTDADYEDRRTMTRMSLGVRDNHVLFFQSGKFDGKKRLLSTLTAFVATPDPNFRLILSGVFAADHHEKEIRRLISSDKRVSFLGWNSPDDLVSLLAASDVYLQPGSQSVTLQNSMCQRCAVVVDNVKSHYPYLQGNGFLTRGGTDLTEIFREFSNNKGIIKGMQQRSHEIALQTLDYSKLSMRLVQSS